MAGSKGTKYFDIFLKYEVGFYSLNYKSRINDDFIKLLEKINETKSLKAAANKLNLSYRKAWGDIIKAENFFGFPLVEKHRGGIKGGGSMLTTDGHELVQSFAELNNEFDQAIKKITKKFFNKINK